MRQSPTGRFFLGRNEDGSYGIKSKEELIRKIKKALIENKRTIVNHFLVIAR
jgi:hypothetical protein